MECEVLEVSSFFPSVHKSTILFGLVLRMMLPTFGLSGRMTSTLLHLFYLVGSKREIIFSKKPTHSRCYHFSDSLCRVDSTSVCLDLVFWTW